MGDPGAGSTGPGGLALLAPDSVGYLTASTSWDRVAAAPWPRWGYLAILRVGAMLGGAPIAAVLLQAIVTLIVGVLLLRTGRRLAGTAAGVVAASVLLVNPMTAQWLRFVLTESLMYALAAATVALAVRPVGPDRDAGLLVAAAGAALLRPTGPLLAAAAVTLVILGRPWARGRRVLATCAVWIVVAGVLAIGSVATGPPAEGTFASQLRDGVVVEGTPDVRVTVAMPPASSEGVVAYVTEHPLAVARLAATRVAVEVAQVRRHYPRIVNVALGVAMVGLGALAAAGLRDARGRPLRVPTAVVLVPLVAIVGATFAVPEGRYGWAGLVALAPAVGVGAATALERLRPQRIGGTAR